MSDADPFDGLTGHRERLRATHLRRLVDSEERERGDLTFRHDGVVLDLSREKLDGAALEALTAAADRSGLAEARRALFAGEAVNATEARPALHMALRGGARPPEGDDVAGVRERFLGFADRIRAGAATDVINIGIGGSDLGPAMAARALAPDLDGPRLHFVSNVDGAHFADTVRPLDPATTLVIVCSKSFRTQETLANAALARDWLGPHAGANMAAVSTNLSACAAFGIPAERVFGFWDWVGGRFSVWSAVGLALAIGIGPERFRSFLDGAAAMDRHFADAPFARNLPVLFALAAFWRRSVMGWPGTALIPYDQRLARFPAFVQQLEMESNGKSVRMDGTPASGPASPAIWGEPGTNAQHSFFQMLHQGGDVIPVDFIAAGRPREADPSHHRMLLANCLAQGRALAVGRTLEEAAAAMRRAGLDEDEIARLAPHRVFPGDRPSITILLPSLTPYHLGQLMALYEHKTFALGHFWGVNPFDQWGVELGKDMAGDILELLARDRRTAPADAATSGLAETLRQLGG
jgi:glucose-6-phosphate isomerase